MSIRGNFLSVFWIMYNFNPELTPVLLTIKSSGLTTSLSSTYLEIKLIKSFPNFLALPSPTPCTLDNSSKVIGYLRAISSKDGSWNTANGGTLCLTATFFLKSFRNFTSFSSAETPVLDSLVIISSVAS